MLGPFLGLLGQHRAIEILSFVVLFKLSDNLTQALLRPFFVQMGFNDFDVGIGPGIVGNVGMMVGTVLGGLLTGWVGLGRALWITGILQIFSNLGYAVVAHLGADRVALYSAQALEFTMSGLGTGAFSVLLLRLTQKRFSATQYALLSSLFSIPRILAGPPTGPARRCHRLARLLHPHDRGGHSRNDHAAPIRSVGHPRADVPRVCPEARRAADHPGAADQGGFRHASGDARLLGLARRASGDAPRPRRGSRSTSRHCCWLSSCRWD